MVLTGREVLDWLGKTKQRVDGALEQILTDSRAGGDELLDKCMRYAVFSGGKRLRPILTHAVGEAIGSDPAELMSGACAVELVHTASLLLDDLPCMDNCTVRRSRPTSHLVFGEDLAILAAVNLLNVAYGLVASYSERGRDPAITHQLLRSLNFAVGPNGLIGGQLNGLHPESLPPGGTVMDLVQARKTASLFCLAAQAGALLSNASDVELSAMTAYACDFGLAFQIRDDILDGDAGAVCGEIGSEERVGLLIDAAISHLGILGDRAFMLREIPRLYLAADGYAMKAI